MKKAVIVVLLCVNVALLLALVLGTPLPQAKAQAYRGTPNYLMITGNVGTNWDGVYIIDLGKRRLALWRFDKTRKRLVPFRGRQLKNDFRREDEDE